MEIEEVKKEVAKILSSQLTGTGFSAFFFGSRIAGTNSPISDLDVGIEGSGAVQENLMRNIKAMCDSIPTLYKIDIVDFSLLSDDFKKVAKSKIEKII